MFELGNSERNYPINPESDAKFFPFQRALIVPLSDKFDENVAKNFSRTFNNHLDSLEKFWLDDGKDVSLPSKVQNLQAMALKRALTSLAEKGLINECDGFYWSLQNEQTNDDN